MDLQDSKITKGSRYLFVTVLISSYIVSLSVKEISLFGPLVQQNSPEFIFSFMNTLGKF